MKRLLFTVAVCFIGYLSYAQVGIGNTDPKSSLDITASNTATPSNTDGILIPRIDDFPTPAPGADQDGMLVFVTGNGVPAEGFYYWDQGSTGWVAVSGSSSDSDWYEVGTSNPADDISDNIYHLGNIVVGSNNTSSTSPLLVQGDVSTDMTNILTSVNGAFSSGTYFGLSNSGVLTGAGNYTAISNSLAGSNDGTIRGVSNSFLNSGTGQKIGFENTFNSADGVRKGFRNYFPEGNSESIGLENSAPGAFSITGALYGVKNDLSSGGNGQRYGVQTVINSTGTGVKYGEWILINSAAGGQHYGVYSDVQKASGYAGYFLGRTSLGTSTTNRYLMPAADGTTGQVITTNGSGQLTFQDQLTGAEKIDDLADGKSDNDGSENGSSIFLGVNSGLNDDGSDNQNIGIGYQSMANITTGSDNTSLGYASLLSNTTYSFHTAIGNEALTSLNGGSGDVALGYRSLYSTTNGSDNVGLGLQSIFSNTTGSSNVGIGSNALYNITTGNQNVAIGRDAAFNYTGSRSVFIGYQAGYNESTGNRLYIENSNANGASALIYGEFDNDILRTNGTFQIGVPSGTGYAFPTSDGSVGQVMTTDGAGSISFQAVPMDGTGTDDQTVDNFGLLGNTLGLSLEDDGQPVQTVDLSNVDFNVSNFALAKMTMTADQSLSGGAFAKLNFDTAAFDVGSNFDTLNDRFVVTEDGYYKITVSTNTLGTDITTNLFQVYIGIAGSVVKRDYRNHQGNGYIARFVQTIEYLTVGQYIEAYAFGQTAWTITSSNQYTSMEVERIR